MARMLAELDPEMDRPEPGVERSLLEVMEEPWLDNCLVLGHQCYIQPDAQRWSIAGLLPTTSGRTLSTASSADIVTS